MAIQSNFPAIKPTLLLDFANTEQLDPRITFTRASTGTYYDGKTVAKAEENLLQFSQQFDDAYWTKVAATVTANTSAAPDGTTTADTVVEDSSTGTHQVTRAVSALASVPYTISCFLKSGTRSFAALQVNTSAAASWVSIDLSTGTLGTLTTLSGGGLPSASASSVSVGNGWYRITLTFTPAAGNAQVQAYFGPALDATTRSYAGNGTGSVLVWGAQLEQRSSATAYTATTTQPITNYIPQLLTAASGVARFEHNPTTGESLGLEIEESRTNLMLQSQFASGWSLTRATLSLNQIVAPDGTLTGSKLVEDTTASNSHFIQRAATVTSGALHTFSVCLKSDGVRGWAALLCIGTTAANNTWFDLVNGVVGSVSANATAAITSLGNGWYRCSITVTSNSTTLTSYVSIATANSVTSYTGNGFSGTYIWGAQLEAGAFATSYIPTVASQVTRAADAASMTGTNFSSWYRADEGTLYSESAASVAAGFSRAMQISDGTTSNFISATTNTSQIRNGGVFQASLNTPGSEVVAGVFYKVALGYKVDDIAASTNGAAALTDISATLPSGSRLQIGGETSSVGANGTIKKLAYYPARVTNAQLQAMTTV